MTLEEIHEAFEHITTYGWLTLEEGILLVNVAEMTKGPMVEIGSYHGRSAGLLARLKEDGKHRPLYCVDPWVDGFSNMSGDEVYNRFLTNIAEVPGAVVFPIRSRVEDWVGIKAEFWYLDGDHTYEGTIAQIDKALAGEAKVIAVHDVNDTGGGRDIRKACLEKLGPWSVRVERLAAWEIKR